MNENEVSTHEATFGGGCFWCIEAVFDELEGVEKVISGYSGGHIKNPAYREVCSGRTGHVEVIRVIYHPDKISFSDLLEVFFKVHDPTTLNRQGADVGEQYRSVVFYHDDEQKELAEKGIQALNRSETYSDEVVTAVEPLQNFYPAEPEHQDYYVQNSSAPYCQAVIRPKMEKFRREFDSLRKS